MGDVGTRDSIRLNYTALLPSSLHLIKNNDSSSTAPMSKFE
jgi:hypothetical protein